MGMKRVGYADNNLAKLGGGEKLEHLTYGHIEHMGGNIVANLAF